MYDEVQVQMAKVLNVPYPKFWQTIGETLKDRSLGERTFAENIEEICRHLNVKADKTQIEKTFALHHEFTRDSLIPEPEVLEGLDRLKRSGLLLGLITNCNSSVPMLFPESSLAQYIDSLFFLVRNGLRNLRAVSMR